MHYVDCLNSLLSLAKKEKEKKRKAQIKFYSYGVIKEISSTSFQLILLTLKFYEKLWRSLELNIQLK